MRTDARTEVLIVGGGPVGLSAAIALSRVGVDCLLVERRDRTTSHPKATILNCRTMELMRLWGLEDAVRDGALSPEQSPAISWWTRLAGHKLGEVSIIGDDARAFQERLAQSPTLPGVSPQDVFEPILAAEAERLAPGRVRFATEVVELFADAGGGVARLACRDGRRRTVSFEYVIAADGARSPVREALGVRVTGTRFAEEILNVHFRAELGPWVGAYPSALYWILNADVRGVIHALDGTDRWLLNAARLGEAPVTATDPAELVRRAVGAPELEVDVLSAKPWSATALIAERFRVGRVFLAGDAAHQLPPTGGFGMNTGIQDVHNLAWKLAAVLRGGAAATILDSYEIERRPVATLNTAQSVHNAEAMRRLFTCVADRELIQVEEETPQGRALRDRIAALIPEQQSHFSFQGQDLGFTYASSLVVSDGSAPPACADPIARYVPTARPGARAPHVWLERDGEELSTLDLFERGYTLLAGAGARGWTTAATAALSGRGVTVLTVGAAGDLDDPFEEFTELYGIGEDGAVLVRPDGHVAWRAHSTSRVAHSDVAAALPPLTARPPATESERPCPMSTTSST